MFQPSDFYSKVPSQVRDSLLSVKLVSQELLVLAVL